MTVVPNTSMVFPEKKPATLRVFAGKSSFAIVSDAAISPTVTTSVVLSIAPASRRKIPTSSNTPIIGATNPTMMSAAAHPGSCG